MNLVPLKLKLLPSFFYYGITAHDKSYKAEYLNEPVNIEGGKIFATWHGRFYCLLKINPRDKLNLLVSKSNDGEIITKASIRMGYKVIRGSASRGGMGAMKGMLDALTAGENVAFTVDGPRGPIHSVTKSVIKLAQQAEVPIIPVIPATNWKVNFNSWDKFNGPLLFAKMKIFYGDPFYVDKDANDEQLEDFKNELATIMKNLTIEADKSVGIINKDFN